MSIEIKCDKCKRYTDSLEIYCPDCIRDLRKEVEHWKNEADSWKNLYETEAGGD